MKARARPSASLSELRYMPAGVLDGPCYLKRAQNKAQVPDMYLRHTGWPCSHAAILGFVFSTFGQCSHEEAASEQVEQSTDMEQ